MNFLKVFGEYDYVLVIGSFRVKRIDFNLKIKGKKIGYVDRSMGMAWDVTT